MLLQEIEIKKFQGNNMYTFNSITRILDARQINALTKRMVKILLNFEKENVFTLHQVGLNSTTLFCHK